MITSFCIVAGVIFILLLAFWKTDGVNILFKGLMGLMAVWAIVCAVVRIVG